MGLHVCLPVLSRLSLIVQRRDIDLTIIEPTLQNTLSALDKFKTTKGPNSATLPDYVMQSILASPHKITCYFSFPRYP